jgi:DNA-binding GntR family transcriptional regulator
VSYSGGMATLAIVRPVPKAETRPPYRQIVDHFQRLIGTGELPPGAPIPSITELKEEWGVVHSTVVRAVRILRDEGWIDSSRGRASVVAAKPPSP